MVWLLCTFQLRIRSRGLLSPSSLTIGSREVAGATCLSIRSPYAQKILICTVVRTKAWRFPYILRVADRAEVIMVGSYFDRDLYLRILLNAA